MSTTITSKRLSAVLAFIIAFAVAAVMAISPAAFAATTNPVGNINDAKDGKGSIIVHKYTEPAATERGNGTELKGQALPKGEVLKGVNFEIYKVNGFDIHDGAKWDTLKNVTVGADGALTGAGGVFTKGKKVGGTQETDGDGKTTFENLAFGAYIVVEADSTDVTKADGTKVNLPKKIKPFIVTIPFPTGGEVAGENGWLYDVNVYPKNQITSNPTKDLPEQDGFAASTGELKWNINVPVPVTGKPLTKFEVQDKLKHGTTTANATPAVVKLGTTVLVANTDYELTEANNLVKITFKSDGLTKLNDTANKGKAVTVELSVKLPTALDASGEDLANQVLNNDYKLVYDDGDGEQQVPPPPTETTPPGQLPPGPIAYFGDFKLHKVSNVEGTKADLKGARFDVYADEAAAKARNTAKAILTGLESNEKGIVDIQDLFLGGLPTSEKDYYVVETKAPDGFVLPTGDAAVKTIHVTVNTGVEAGDMEVDNTPVGKIPSLPLTGAAGKVLLTLGGIAIVMLAAGTVLATRRRKA